MQDLPMLKCILVPTDGSQGALRAVQLATSLAKAYNAELHIIHVIPRAPTTPTGLSSLAFDPSRFIERSEADAKRIIEEAVAYAKGYGVEANGRIVKTVTSTAQSISNEASGCNADLIVIGSRGLSSLRKLILGSVSSGVVSHAHSPVMVVR